MKNIFPKSLPASLARRLAEAADGFRNVDQVYFIAGYKFPHPIKDFPDLTSAENYFTEKGFKKAEYSIFGPYKTNDELKTLSLSGVEDIKKIDLSIQYKDGHKEKYVLHGPIDSIFLNLSSFDKFVFPYYCGIFGADYAKKMRDRLVAHYKNQDKSGTQFTALSSSQSSPPGSGHSNLTLFFGLSSDESL